MTNKAKFALIKKRLQLKNSDIARMFGYASEASFRNSSKKPVLISGLIEFYEKCGEVYKFPEDKK